MFDGAEMYLSFRCRIRSDNYEPVASLEAILVPFGDEADGRVCRYPQQKKRHYCWRKYPLGNLLASR